MRLDCLWGGCRTRTLSRDSLHFIGRSCISISSRRQAPTCVASAETRGHPAFMFIVQSNAFSSLLIVRTRDPKGGGAFVLGAEDTALPGGLAEDRCCPGVPVLTRKLNFINKTAFSQRKMPVKLWRGTKRL